MTREEAIKYLIKPVATSTEIGEEKQKEFEAYNMAIEALSADAVSRDVYDKRTQADEEIIDSYRKEFQKAISADRPITSGYIADDKEVPPYTTTSAVSADRPTIEHDREWIIGCIKHDGFIKTDRFDKANQIILDALSAEAVQGEWIMHGEPPWYVRECSKCGTKWHQWSGDSNPNFCGHCGAKMKGGTNG